MTKKLVGKKAPNFKAECTSEKTYARDDFNGKNLGAVPIKNFFGKIIIFIDGSRGHGFEKTKWKKIKTPWGNPSDEILLANLGKEEICFISRHSRGHKINPSNINFRANIDAMKQLGVTDIISVSAVGSLKKDLEPGKFKIISDFMLSASSN